MTEHANIESALAAARGEFAAIKRDSRNPQYGSTYASLAAIVDTITPALSKHGLAYVQHVSTRRDDAGWVVVVHGRLHHASGGVMDFGELSLPVVPIVGKSGGGQPITHAIGSAITYARRYKIGGDLNIVTDDDDDGNANAGQQPQRQQQRPTAPPPPQPRQAPPTKPTAPSNGELEAIDGFCARLATCQTLAELGVVAQEIGTQSQAVREGCKQAYVLAKANITEGGGA